MTIGKLFNPRGPHLLNYKKMGLEWVISLGLPQLCGSLSLYFCLRAIILLYFYDVSILFFPWDFKSMDGKDLSRLMQ